jgi:hypothetical protein
MSSLPLDGGTTSGSRGGVIPQSRWDEVRAKVTRLYWEQGKTLEQVMAQMQKDGFIATYTTSFHAALYRECISL